MTISLILPVQYSLRWSDCLEEHTERKTAACLITLTDVTISSSSFAFWGRDCSHTFYLQVTSLEKEYLSRTSYTCVLFVYVQRMTSSFVLIKFVLRTWLFSHVQTSSHITWDIIERFWAPRDPSGTRWETEHVSQNLKRFADTMTRHKVSNLCVTLISMVGLLGKNAVPSFEIFWGRLNTKWTDKPNVWDFRYMISTFMRKEWAVRWVYWGRKQYHHLIFIGKGWIPHGQANPTYEI